MKRLGDTSSQSAAETMIASAATTNLATSKNRNIAISGTTTITSFGTGINKEYLIRFTGSLTLTHNSTSLILPSAQNIVTKAGDTALVISDNSGNWRVLNYTTSTPFLASGTGYVFLPSGLIIQWGIIAPTASDSTINFTIPFPNNLFTVNVTPRANAGATSAFAVSTSAFSTSGFTVNCRLINGSSVSGQGNLPLSWMAIGN
jgi:hypothetical protein